jgi:hypothetical protein
MPLKYHSLSQAKPLSFCPQIVSKNALKLHVFGGNSVLNWRGKENYYHSNLAVKSSDQNSNKGTLYHANTPRDFV